MNLLAAGRAVENELAEFLLQIGLHLEQFQPNLFGADGDRVI